MSSREQYTPGAASGAEVQKDGEKWTLVLVRDLSHPPAKVWKAITDPEHLREWAPFDSDTNLGAVGTAKLTTVGAPTPHVTETHVKRAEAPKVLEFSWGDFDIRCRQRNGQGQTSHGRRGTNREAGHSKGEAGQGNGEDDERRQDSAEGKTRSRPRCQLEAVVYFHGAPSRRGDSRS
jgi:uncharacterized protein YndB with AHSA1/START domain